MAMARETGNGKYKKARQNVPGKAQRLGEEVGEYDSLYVLRRFCFLCGRLILFCLLLSLSPICIVVYVCQHNPNVVHLKEALVDAEWLSLKRKQEEAIQKYEVAIMMAGRIGLLQDRAKAHELFNGF
jgi:hypothetical protein